MLCVRGRCERVFAWGAEYQKIVRCFLGIHITACGVTEDRILKQRWGS